MKIYLVLFYNLLIGTAILCHRVPCYKNSTTFSRPVLAVLFRPCHKTEPTPASWTAHQLGGGVPSVNMVMLRQPGECGANEKPPKIRKNRIEKIF